MRHTARPSHVEARVGHANVACTPLGMRCARILQRRAVAVVLLPAPSTPAWHIHAFYPRHHTIGAFLISEALWRLSAVTLRSARNAVTDLTIAFDFLLTACKTCPLGDRALGHVDFSAGVCGAGCAGLVALVCRAVRFRRAAGVRKAACVRMLTCALLTNRPGGCHVSDASILYIIPHSHIAVAIPWLRHSMSTLFPGRNTVSHSENL